MRRQLTISITVVCLAVLAGCGSSKSGNASTPAGGSTAAGSSTDSVKTDPLAPAGCAKGSAAAASEPVIADSPPKPKVQIPSSLPKALVCTDLVEGTGTPAKAGDDVSVYYVGVRTADGKEFDSNFGSQPFPVTLGAGRVISGWDIGLVGVKAGGRRQLDIPSNLAYGDKPQGDVIKAGDALTFVIQVVSVTTPLVVPDANPADAPTVSIPTSVGATKLGITDLVTGTGETAVANGTAYLQLDAYRGDTGAVLESTWKTGKALKIVLNSGTIKGLVDGVSGMKVGGRRLLIVPSDQGFGPDGNTKNSLPTVTDLVLVVDLVGFTK
ncbi:MAG: FKBP-type peptidyl-prolyl cis-trans isomerase [Actinomycetota bacterium]|jgi:peptidylprolyl isomerase